MNRQGIITPRLASLALLTAALAGPLSAQQPASADPEVSVNIRNEHRPADRVIDFTATPGSYVTLIRVSPVGHVEILYPSAAVVDRAMVPSSKRIAVPRMPTPTNPMTAGSIFAFVSNTPFVFSRVADRNGWNSLHLANYSAATDEAIAVSFGNEITAPHSRVMMSKATTSPVAIISHDHSPTMASLASFRAQDCPSFALPVGNSSSGVTCVIQGISFPSPKVSNPGQPQRSVSTK